jgi:hypothetical protein
MKCLVYDTEDERTSRNEQAIRQKGWYEGTTKTYWLEIDQDGKYFLAVGDGDGLLTESELSSRVEVDIE